MDGFVGWLFGLLIDWLINEYFYIIIVLFAGLF